MTTFDDFDKKAFIFLKTACEKGMNDMYKPLGPYSDVGINIGIDQKESENIAQYLGEKHLIDYHPVCGGQEGHFMVTSYGIDTVRSALRNPEKPSRYFPAVINIIKTGNITHSTVPITQNSPGSTQVININESSYPKIVEIIDDIERHSKELGLDETQRLVLLSDVHTIRTQIGSPRPKNNIINECWSSVKDFMVQTAATVAGAAIYAKMQGII